MQLKYNLNIFKIIYILYAHFDLCFMIIVNCFHFIPWRLTINFTTGHYMF